MARLLDAVFGLVCGQDPSHTWAPGDVPLPLCERCSGVYAGALFALALRALARPPQGARSLAFHALLLLQVVPSGLDLWPQGPFLRTLSGAVFGWGLAYFLVLGAQSRSQRMARAPSDGPRHSRSLPYGAAMALGLLVVLALARWDSAPAGDVLSALCLGGLASVVALAVIDVVLAGRAAFKALSCDRTAP